jgi:glutamate 5-kinase
LYTADPRKDPAATFVQEATAGDAVLETMAGGAGSSLGKGGMITKILAAKRAATSGAHTVIAWGREPEVLVRLAKGEAIGTQLTAHTATLAAKKQWLADHLQVRGSVTLDAGATRALLREGKSLLPIGVTQVSGEFERGEAIAIRDDNQVEIARGLVNYAAAEARLIMRKLSSEIEATLGHANEPELVHRDNLVLVR